MRHRRILAAVLAASALAAGGAVAAVSLTRAEDAPPGCDDIRAYQQRFGEIERLGAGDRELTVLGDSYSAGDSLRDRGRRWTDALPALEPGLTVELDAIAFTGYVNTGGCGPNSFRDRIDRAVAEVDRTLVIQGGLNDVYAQPATLERAASAVLDAARAVDRVVVVGPVDVPGREGEAAVDGVLADAAEARGLAYVSTLDWDLPVGPDRVHLTAEGHRAYAERLRDALVVAGAL
ncbi:hypothetical protein B5M43_001990 [Microbacterium sp. MEC084]|jgi:lysophospholipase L1-like esterase|uniref:SGNH/GDSL hydrolase family protein n=1 Tax=unclassified Microbacterium TaxID=2609290 RepID=UPI0006F898A1|nr:MULTISPECIES: SGNH/GDSL hydrolase family protein [unclassified Microbacterium]KQZ04985.1 hypothetical protein ASD19_02990 [Microbacterium sp. Root53]MCD1267623.1 hypothetical protein [Microbacterium sp. MEC084]